MRAVTPLVLAAASVVLGCGVGSTGPPSSDTRGTVTVSAAASLVDVLTRLADDFEAAHPGVDVRLNVDSSSRLAAQVLEGAPADVFASADGRSMDELVDAGLVPAEPVVFARNELAIVTARHNAGSVAGLADLPDVGIVALCAAEAPCGVLAGAVLDAAGVSIPPSRVTRGQNARATLRAVTDGDAAAGIVFVTDASAAGDRASTVAIPPEQNAVTEYPVAVLDGAGNPGLASAFVAFLSSDAARAALEADGFLSPR